MALNYEPKIVGFLCNWCSYAGADLAGTSRITYPANLRIIRVPCSGRVDPLFVVKALQELRREGALPASIKLLTDQVYGPGPQSHAPYHYEKHVLDVSGEARAVAQEAAWFYQSQSGNRALGNLRTFDELPRSEVHWQVLDWLEHEGWNDKE